MGTRGRKSEKNLIFSDISSKVTKQKASKGKKNKAEDLSSPEHVAYRVADPPSIDYNDGIEEIFIQKHRIRIERQQENARQMADRKKKRRLLGKGGLTSMNADHAN